MVLLDTPLFHRCWEEVSLLGVPVPFEERRKEGLRGREEGSLCLPCQIFLLLSNLTHAL